MRNISSRMRTYNHCRDAAKIDKTRLPRLTKHRRVATACQSRPSSDARLVARVAHTAAGGDAVFRQSVLARIIEPTSKADSLRVIEETRVPPVSYPTLNLRLAAFAKTSLRQALPQASAAHAALGPAPLVLYDMSTVCLKRMPLTVSGARIHQSTSSTVQTTALLADYRISKRYKGFWAVSASTALSATPSR